MFGQIPLRPVYTEQTATRPASAYPIDIAINWHVDAQSGSDGNAGSLSAPLRTLDRARELAAPRDVIGLMRGQTHFRTAGSGLGDTVTQTVIGYGDSTLPATLSGGQVVPASSFSAVGGGVYKAVIRLPKPHTPGGSGLSSTNTTYPFVRIAENYFEWIVDKPTLTDNLDRLTRSPGPAFVIAGTGSSVADIRNEPSGLASFDLYVRLAAGAAPNGNEIVAMAHANTYVWGGELLQDIAIRDAWSKDTTGSEPFQTGVPLLRRVESIGGGCHGWVGSCNVDGFRARGVPRPGMFGFEQGRAAGGGLNLFSAWDRRGEAFELRGLDIQGFNAALYGHTSSEADFFARRITIKGTDQEGFADFRVRNCEAAIKYDPGPKGSTIAERTDIECEVDLVDIDRMIFTESPLSMTVGGTVIFASISENGQSLAVLQTDRANVELAKLLVYTPRTHGSNFGLDLYQATGSAVGEASIVIRDCELPTHPSYSFRIGRRSRDEAKAKLTLTGATVMGDIVQPVLEHLPTALTVRDNCVFGFADLKSRQAVRNLLDRNGIANEIQESVTLLRSSGAVADNPAK